MAKVTTNKQINIVQLDNELANHGLCIDKNDTTKKVITTADDSPITQSELENAIDNHVAVFQEPTIEEKLASVGLSINDLKMALGI